MNEPVCMSIKEGIGLKTFIGRICDLLLPSTGPEGYIAYWRRYGVGHVLAPQ